MVSRLVVHKELEYKVDKLKYKKRGDNAVENQNPIPETISDQSTRSFIVVIDLHSL